MSIDYINARYELKFTQKKSFKNNIYFQIFNDKNFFRKAYNKRRINNIYFDTHNYKFFSDNVVGISDRVKIRVRWYGDSFINNCEPNLEFKFKKGAVGYKKIFKLKKFDFSDKILKNDFYTQLKNITIEPKLRILLNRSKPVIINSYLREYFITSDSRFRITYDTNICFYSCINSYKNISYKYNLDIFELKFKKEHYDAAVDLINQYNFRLEKSSKYVSGISLLKEAPNIF